MTTLLPNAKQQFFSAAGVPLAGGFVFTYVPGTTTPKSTWADSGQITLNTNPIVLDAAGEALIYGQGAYRTILQDSLSNTVWDQLTASTDTGGIYSGTTSTGTAANQILATTTPSGFALTAGNQLTFLAGFTCTGATTLNANGTGAKNILKPGATGPIALVAGDFGVGDALALFYDGTQFQLLDALAVPISGGSLTGALNIKRTASAATVVAGVLDISAISANFIQLSETGGGAITSLGAAGDGAWRMLDFTGAAPGTLTGSATMLIPTAGNIIPIQQNDTATFVWVGTVAVLVNYQRATGQPVATATGTLTAGAAATKNPYALSTSTAQAHGLGAMPFIVVAYVECLTAELGYSIGDRVIIDGSILTGTTPGAVVVAMDATNLTISISNVQIALPNKGTGGALTSITVANWKVVATPYKLN